MGYTKNRNFYRVPYLQIFAPGAAFMMILNLSESLAKPLVMAKLNMAHLSSLKNEQNCCRPTCRCHHLVVKFKKRAKLLSSYLPVSPSRILRAPGTSLYHHITVPFGAEAPSGHMAQAWAIPPPSWGLLSQLHRQETTTPETNGASSARTQRHS